MVNRWHYDITIKLKEAITFFFFSQQGENFFSSYKSNGKKKKERTLFLIVCYVSISMPSALHYSPHFKAHNNLIMCGHYPLFLKNKEFQSLRG